MKRIACVLAVLAGIGAYFSAAEAGEAQLPAVSRHALVQIAPAGRWVVQIEARTTDNTRMFDSRGNDRPLAADYNGIPLDASILPPLALLGPGATLGSTATSAAVVARSAQITLAYGVTEDFTLGVIGNFGTVRNNVNFSVSGGNVGWNPLYDPALPIAPANFPFAPVIPGVIAPMGAADVNTILTSPAFGYGYEPIGSSTVNSMGTLLLGGLWRFYEDERSSLVAGLGLRWSFTKQNPDALLRVPFDDGSTDIVSQLEYYRQLPSIFDLRLMAKQTTQLPDRMTSRVPAPGQFLAPASTKEVLNRNLGDFWEFDVEVGASIADWRLSGTWHHYFKSGDSYFSPRGQNVAALMQNTSQRAEQWRIGLSWSGLDAWLEKSLPLPLIIKLEMQETQSGRNMANLRDIYLVTTTFF